MLNAQTATTHQPPPVQVENKQRRKQTNSKKPKAKPKAQISSETPADEALKSLAISEIPQHKQHHLEVEEEPALDKEICTHLYQQGFLAGAMSDITVRFMDQLFHLHRLILIRSPFFERILVHNQQQQQQPQQQRQILNLPLIDGNVTPESLSICLAYLYGASIKVHIKPENQLNVLACAFMLQLGDVCTYCCNQMIKSLDLPRVLSIIDTPSPAAYGEYSERIHAQCIQYLAQKLPLEFEAFTEAEGADRLIAVYADVPFVVLKEIVERALDMQSEYEKYQFAQRVLQCRKSRRHSQHQHGWKKESVLLVFDSDMRGKVVLSNEAPSNSRNPRV